MLTNLSWIPVSSTGMTSSLVEIALKSQCSYSSANTKAVLNTGSLYNGVIPVLDTGIQSLLFG
ncbi:MULTISPECIES: hypothetical protein [Wolbachia]|uniref:hypothetical protein n=1 Tax=Wolbachia TaxID=953 RepID=UPI002175475F|nr:MULTISPECIES: hypothetical protein [Wolbachia]MDE5061364.1 hypothetical protein [Wolbachia endosymbiont of Drosophila nikananu]